MSKLRKKGLLVERGGEPIIFRHPSNEEHNEVTVAVINFAIPMANVTKTITKEVVEKIKKAAICYPGTGISFNYNPDAPAILFSCKGKTERRRDDVPNQELADNIAIAKCRAQACKIGRRLLQDIAETFEKEYENLINISYFFGLHAEREISRFKKLSGSE